MCYRKLISAVVFVVFGFCFAEAARAQSCDPNAGDFDPFFCDPFDPSCACNSWYYLCPDCTMNSTTGSSIDCQLQAGGSNVLNTNAATFAETAKAACMYKPNTGLPTDLGTCDFELVMTGVALTGCTPGTTCHATGLCTDKNLQVTGTLSNCSLVAGVLNFGIAGMQRNINKCTTVFPNGILPANQVLDVSFTTNTDGSYVHISDTKARWCNSGDLSNSNVDCQPPSGVVRKTDEQAPSAVPFAFNVRQTVNTSPKDCKGGTTIDKGSASIDVFGSPTIHVADIDLTSLTCEGVPVTCGDPTFLNSDGFPDRACSVPTCPTFGPALGKLPRNPDGTVTATCTGALLLPSGQAILGFDEVKVSP